MSDTDKRPGPESDENSLELANSATNYPAKSRRSPNRKAEKDEIEILRQRVAALEAEKRSLYQQVFLLQQRLETSGANQKERANFVSTVAHELRTPLTSIKGYIDLVLEGETGEVNDVQREFLAIAGANADRLASIIGDLLDVARLEGGRTAFKPVLTELVGLVQSLVESSRPQFAAKGVQFETTIPLGSHLEMLADPDRLTQALRALLSNAGLYTSRGGVVRLKLKVGPEPKQAEIVVSDSGPEISPAELPRVFTLFFHPSNLINPESTTGSSTGLGLAIAKAVIEMHQGQVEVESEPGKGNHFVVRLPLLNGVESAAVMEPAVRVSPTVLVISQAAEFAQTIQKVLKSEGFQVVVAREREEVVAETPAWQPDLIIENGSEWQQSENAFQTSSQLAVERRTPKLVLSLSMFEQRAFLAGALAVLPWPVEDEARLKAELVQVVANDLTSSALTEFVAAQTVLVVCTQTAILRAFDRLLRDMGHTRVFRATMEADALALARRHRPTLLLFTGDIELFEDLHSDPLLRNVAAVIFTSVENIAPSVQPEYHASSSDTENNLLEDVTNKVGVLNTLPKPLTRRRLLNVVRRLTRIV